MTVRPILSKALMDAVAGRPGGTLAASIYAAPEADRREAAVVAAQAGLWVHADVIVTDGVNRGVDVDLIRDLAAHQIGPLDIHLIIEGSHADRLPELIEEICGIPVSRITVPVEAITDVPAVAERIRTSGAAPWLAIGPATDPGNALIHRAHIDGVLVMLIQPGTTSQADETISRKAEAIAPHRTRSSESTVASTAATSRRTSTREPATSSPDEGCSTTRRSRPGRSKPVDARPDPLSRPWLEVGDEVAELLANLDSAAFDAAVEALRPAGRRWFTTGRGRSGLIAQMTAMRLMHLGRTVHVLGEATATSVQSADGLLVISA
ncbi:hypothetical protein [Actinospica sp.]|uniref:hypothetical protein n=1 Tax=Actinospica sp. TaxID=1872142 RepID=UPI002C76D476|nr:hypothetical protein [Actinospica sp.]HWG23602.1 hypothetical protein [Actinospica sp.]